MKVHVIDTQFTWGSNFTKSSNRIPVIEHPHDHAPSTLQIRAQRTNHDQEFCFRYVSIIIIIIIIIIIVIIIIIIIIIVIIINYYYY